MLSGTLEVSFLSIIFILLSVLILGIFIGIISYRYYYRKETKNKNALFEFLFERAPVGLHLSTFAPDGQRLSYLVNPRHCQITGIPDEKVDDPKAYEAISHPDDYAQQEKLYKQLENGSIDTFSIDKRYIKENGSYNWARLTFYRNQLPDGGFQILVTAVDMDKIKEVESQILRQTELTKVILETTPVGLSANVYHDGEKTNQISNQAHDRITGVKLKSAEPNAYKKVTHPDDRVVQKQLYDRMKKREIEEYRITKRYIRESGEVVWVDFHHLSKWYPDQNERIEITCIQDITELKNALSQAEFAVEEATRANRAKSEFLAMMSHEIRTPMNGVIGMTSILQNIGLTTQQLECVETIRNSGESLLSIINDILDFSKIESGNLQLEKDPFELRQCLECALDLLANKAAERDIDLLYQINDSVPFEIYGDANRLRQVVVNLLGNAIKFTHKGHVLLSVLSSPIPDAPQQLNLTIAIEDTGIGIPPEKIDQLFDPFVQADASTTRQYGGTGLGLSISQKMIGLMGGTITVESNPGQGSLFQFTIPVEYIPARQKLHPTSIRNRLKNRRILIVDDNPTNLQILESWLLDWNTVPVAFDHPLATLDSLEKDADYAVAILDMNMPEMDGQELAIAIKEKLGKKAFPLILLSSLDDQHSNIDRTLFESLLTKPAKPDQLKDSITRSIIGHQPYKSRKAPVISTGEVDRSKPILVVEDNAVNQKVVHMMLKQLGYTADVAANGYEAIDACNRQHYDIILMDMVMPEMDGLTATDRIRKKNGTNGTSPYIIALTANAMEEDRENCINAGMNDFLSKPIQLKSLSTALKKALDT